MEWAEWELQEWEGRKAGGVKRGKKRADKRDHPKWTIFQRERETQKGKKTSETAQTSDPVRQEAEQAGITGRETADPSALPRPRGPENHPEFQIPPNGLTIPFRKAPHNTLG